MVGVLFAVSLDAPTPLPLVVSDVHVVLIESVQLSELVPTIRIVLFIVLSANERVGGIHACSIKCTQ